jgi:hypothetical protein
MRRTPSVHALIILIAALLFAVGCGVKLPPIQVVVDPSKVITPDPKPAPAPVGRATLAFVVMDANEDPIRDARAAVVPSGASDVAALEWPATKGDGYTALEVEQDTYRVTISAPGYQAQTVDVTLTQNTQRAVVLTKVAAAPAPPAALQDLFITVAYIQSFSPGTSKSVAIPNAWCTVAGERRVADGSGFVHFPVPGTVSVECGAEGFITRADTLAPGRRGFDLWPAPPPKPVEPPALPTPSPLCDRTGDGLTCARAVAEHYAHLLKTNTYESCVEFIQRLLEALGPEWGHVGKTAAERGKAIPRGFTPIVVDGVTIVGVSHDAIKHRDTGQVIDIVVAAAGNSSPDPKHHGPASVGWIVVPPHEWRAENPFVPAVPVR